MTRRRLILAAAAVGAALAATALPTARLTYLALPLARDPSVRAPVTPRTVEEGEAPARRDATRVPGRISAILPLYDETLFIATFDEGLYRFDPHRDRAPVPVGALDGRERFVDALVLHGDHVVAATHRGAVVLATDGARAGVLAAGEAVSSLATADDELILGTAHGLWRGSDDRPVGERGPDGETLRVTALAVGERSNRRGPRLFVGTADGVYILATPLAAQVARWQPLVFGTPAASTNVVTALATLGDGVIAGTDDGGLVFVDDDGAHAAPFTEVTSNDVNAGALARVGAVTLVGTEGGGLIAVDGAHVRRLGPKSRVTALAPFATRLWVGDDHGAVYALAASRIC